MRRHRAWRDAASLRSNDRATASDVPYGQDHRKRWRGADAYATARSWNPSDLLVVDLSERDDTVAV